MKQFMIYAAAAVLALVIAVPAAFAFGGVTISGPISVSGSGSTGLGMSSLGITPHSISAGHPGPNIHLTGKLLKPGEQAPPGHRVVKLRLDGRVIPMELMNTAETRDDFRFLHNSEYQRELQRIIFGMDLQVRGNQQDLAEINRAVDTATPLVVHGHVFSLVAPYMIVTSVQTLPKPVHDPAR